MTDTPNAKSSVNDTSGDAPWLDREPTPHDRPEVVEQATLLPSVAALAACVNSDRCSDQDRARLREFVPGGTYYFLLNNLLDLRSQRARDHRRVTKRSGEVIDWTGFFNHYHEPIPHQKSRS